MKSKKKAPLAGSEVVRVRMTKGDATATPLKNAVPLWEAQGWKVDPEESPASGDDNAR